MGIGERLRLLRDRVSLKDFGERFGVAPNTYKKYEGGESSPSIDFLLSVCEAFDVSLPWLVEGTGPKYKTSGTDASSPPSTVKEPEPSPSIYMDSNGDVVIPRWQSPDPEVFDYVPMAEAQLSAGGGSFVISQDLGDYYAFRKSWLSRVASSPKNLVLMRVSGNSMAPTMEHDDTVMIDVGKKTFREGSIYAIRVDDTVMVKRLSLRLDGKVLVISDNRTEYEPFEADRKSLHIIGQVIFFCRTFMTD